MVVAGRQLSRFGITGISSPYKAHYQSFSLTVSGWCLWTFVGYIIVRGVPRLAVFIASRNPGVRPRDTVEVHLRQLCFLALAQTLR